METLAYLHLALVYETPVQEAGVSPVGENQEFLTGLNWKKLSSHATIHFLSIAVALAMLGIASQALAQRTLKQGDRGSEVRALQQRLQARGFSVPATGNFGSKTRNAVIRFQQANRLTPDGIVGRGTRAELFNQVRPTISQTFNNDPFTLPPPDRILDSVPDNPTLSAPNIPTLRAENIYPEDNYSEDTYADIRLVQQQLVRAGFNPGSIDGAFGPKTARALREFQGSVGLYPSGTITSETLRALEDDIAGRPSQQLSDYSNWNARSRRSLQPGDRGSEVEDLQRRLSDQGFNPGGIDGIYGSNTQRAVRRFQQARRLYPDGIADARTLGELGINFAENRYVVVVPGNNQTLNKVLRYVPNADLGPKSKRGSYVNAGAFSTRHLAESRSELLRSRGLDARVVYRP
ncbi:peptidoglycan-binding protein [Coleofasciculus sp. FACHB-1120]|uniref:peptidoglycan-binding domain-containing protein n=1 Tax=Coleofasciculus sp. FACHB-1120 TaxID=2692783 RepID=UPI001682060F|nr:peptidoglycan-binding protein [Coleofasciculus sp. FACHB-1120]MBD2741715.1 peptidoglycan-binding protein [Coleofasciculus sp. FACHB-1120]